MRTEKALDAALEELLASRSIDDISVCDITRRAEVGRSTFYKHYVDKYALVEEWFFRKCGGVIPPAWEQTRSYSQASVAFLQYVSENRAIMHSAFKSADANSLGVRLVQISKPFLEQALAEGGADVNNPSMQVIVEVFVRGTCSLIVDWIQGKIEIPPENFILMQVRSMPAELACYIC